MPLVWITVSHPGMAESDTIGDMVRLKLIRSAFQSLGWTVRLVTAEALAGAPPPAGGHPDAAAPRSPKGRLKQFVPRAVWATLKDLAYRRLNGRFYDLLAAQPGPLPDLIVDYNFYFNDAALRFGRARGIPVILNSETLVEDSMRDVPHSWLRGAGRRFETRKYRRASRMWAVSDPLAAKLRALIGGAGVEVDVVPNAAAAGGDGVACTLRLPAGARVVGFVGGFSPWYALDRLVEACARIREKVPALHLLLVGDGPERARIETMLAATPPGWYTLTGRVPHAEVPGYVACFDVGVITNHMWWTSPLKLLEYGAMGTAVVAPDLPSITAMVTADEAALFAHGDFQAFEQVLGGLLADAPRRARLAQNLRGAVETRYSMAALAQTIAQSVARVAPALAPQA